MLLAQIKAFAFAIFIGVFIYRVSIVADMFSGLAAGKGMAVWQSAGHLVHHDRGS